jgi:hypothetical protein
MTGAVMQVMTPTRRKNQLPGFGVVALDVGTDADNQRCSAAQRKTYRPKEMIAATMVAIPFAEYQSATRMGCSDRWYHFAVRILNKGRQPASKRPRRKRVATREW